MQTVADVLGEIGNWVGDSGTCDEAKQLTALNQARRILWNKADWPNTMEYLKICCACNCLTLPSIISQVRLAWSGNCPLSLQSEWYQSIDGIGLDASTNCFRQFVNVGGYHVTFREFPGIHTLSIYSESQLDAGSEIVIDVLTPASTRKSISFVLGNAFTYVNSTVHIVGMLQVVKPKTTGRIRVYGFNESGQFVLLAIYQPYDVNPFFQKYKVPKGCLSVTVYAKKKYFDLSHDYELVEFPTDAIIPALIAVNNRENRDLTAYLNSLQVSTLEAKAEMSNDEIKNITPIKIENPYYNGPLSGGWYGYGWF